VRIAREEHPQRWLLSYRPHLYAGLQVALQCLLNGGTLVIPAADDDPNRIVRQMIEAEVEYGSATPSYWRRILLLADRSELQKVPLRQITLGGELVDQLILDQLHAVFPHARIVHIYATTEMGRCFAVTDQRAGFPISFLDQPTADGVEIKVEQGQLFVRSANAMIDYYADTSPNRSPNAEQAWFATGDIVDVQGDRVYFAGRKGDIINVGGNKVHPALIENVLREVPGVVDVRVFGRSSSLSGQIVACEIMVAEGVPEDRVRSDLLEACQQRLSTYQRPRLIDFVPEIAVTGAGKKQRR
jgi:acyl-CoA synthetase (AMP-forming)/AMP-acid ligase II